MTVTDHGGGWVGVLLAAGRARRFGGSKQLAVWPATGLPLVATAFDAIAPACALMVVVLGHQAEAVRAALGPRRFEDVRADPDAPMFESVRAGLRAVLAHGQSNGAVLQPADHPGVRPETVARLARESGLVPGVAVMPEFEGAGGHPAFIPRSLIHAVLDYDGAGGLREFWHQRPEHCRRVRVEDRGVVADVDVPGDIPRQAFPRANGP